jgi:hypothetical protein
MAKRNWYDTINDRMPAERKNHKMISPFDFFGLDDYDLGNIRNILGNPPLTKLDSLMSDLEGIGFQDKKDHYEFVTELVGNGDVKEDAVKIELLHDDTLSIKDVEDTARVKVTYEHTVSTEHSHYSHSQTTCVTLPEDADEETLAAHFDAKNRVVVTVGKKVQKKANYTRNIPIQGV